MVDRDAKQNSGIDEQINAKKVKTCERKVYGVGLSGVTSYCDYENRVVGKDLWEDSGRLKWRSFFSNGELIARDEFIDSGKERSFFRLWWKQISN